MMATENLQAAEHAARDITEDLTRQTTGCAVDIDQTEVFNPLFSPQQRLSFDPPIAVAIPTAVSYTDQSVITAASTVVMEADTGTELLDPIYVFSPEKTAFIESISALGLNPHEESTCIALWDGSNACLYNCDLTNQTLLERVIYALRMNTEIQTLMFENCQIDDTIIIPIAALIKTKSGIGTLCIDRNKIGDKGAAIIAQALEGKKEFKCLQLTHNKVGNVGLGAIAHFLRSSQSISSIYLSSNRISCTDALESALLVNKSLFYLDLSKNIINGTGIRGLANGLKTNYSLKWVILIANHIGDLGVHLLCEMLKQNTTLKNLEIELNHISHQGAQELVDTLRHHNVTLLSLYFNIGDTFATFEEEISTLKERKSKALDRRWELVEEFKRQYPRGDKLR